ncbi:MAG: sigma 54-interacting transcriptional regulator [Planctomycetaceae bacterium]
MWLSSTTTPVFILDDRRRVLFFNKGCEQLTGWEAGDVIGQVCDFVSEPDPTQIESLTGTLCPPPEVLQGAEISLPVFLHNRSGNQTSHLIRFFPLKNVEGRVERILGTFSRIPEPVALQPPLGRELHAELAALRADLLHRYAASSVVGCSRGFHRLMEQVRLAGCHNSSLHLFGEAGTGKEHLARLIHYQGPSRRQAFVPLDCRRLTREEIKLAVREVLRDAREGQPTRLSPGTLFLKNVEALPDSVQELLLEEAPTVLVAESHAPDSPSRSTRNISLRLMSSSETDLQAAVDQDRLSHDLYYLLTSQVITVPSLRQLPEDVMLLAQHFLESLNRDQETQVTGFADEVAKAFRKYKWPGNQDELKTVVNKARAACERSLITLADLPLGFRAGQDAQRSGPVQSVELVPLEDRLAAVEREHIELALRQAGDNKSLAAESLGMTRARLYRRMQILGMIDSP